MIHRLVIGCMIADVYLLVGAILMLVANELLGGMTRSQFVLGMLIWPELLRRWACELFLSYYRRSRG